MTPHDSRASEIGGAVLFERVQEFITRFVRLSEHEAIATTLWVMMTHALDVFDCVPYLSITSAEKQSGKSLLLEVLELVVARPWRTFRASPAVLLRRIARDRPTLLLDESDAAFKGPRDYAETLRGLLNAGYRRPGNQSFCVPHGKTFELVDFPTFCPKAIAGIGDLPDTIADRSIPIRLVRKRPGETVERFRYRYVEADASGLHAECQQWATSFSATEHPEPSGLDALPDRAANICEPLLAIAESCEDDSLGVRTLSDIEGAFKANGDKLASADLAKHLAEIEEGPWGPRFGRDFGARDLAKLLKPFGIRPRTIRLDDGTTPKGYHRSDFADAWERYLPSREKPPQSPQAPQANKIKPSQRSESATTTQRGETEAPQPSKPPREKARETRIVADVADVAPSRNGKRLESEVLDGEDFFENEGAIPTVSPRHKFCASCGVVPVPAEIPGALCAKCERREIAADSAGEAPCPDASATLPEQAPPIVEQTQTKARTRTELRRRSHPSPARKPRSYTSDPTQLLVWLNKIQQREQLRSATPEGRHEAWLIRKAEEDR
jgi:Protein of unknown function (DUF3631)